MKSGLNDKLPSPEWLRQRYGILWDGQYSDLGGTIAQVVKIEQNDVRESLVVRISDPRRISQDRLSLGHRFQTHLSTRGVRVEVGDVNDI